MTTFSEAAKIFIASKGKNSQALHIVLFDIYLSAYAEASMVIKEKENPFDYAVTLPELFENYIRPILTKALNTFYIENKMSIKNMENFHSLLYSDKLPRLNKESKKRLINHMTEKNPNFEKDEFYTENPDFYLQEELNSMVSPVHLILMDLVHKCKEAAAQQKKNSLIHIRARSVEITKLHRITEACYLYKKSLEKDLAEYNDKKTSFHSRFFYCKDFKEITHKKIELLNEMTNIINSPASSSNNTPLVTNTEKLKNLHLFIHKRENYKTFSEQPDSKAIKFLKVIASVFSLGYATFALSRSTGNKFCHNMDKVIDPENRIKLIRSKTTSPSESTVQASQDKLDNIIKV